MSIGFVIIVVVKPPKDPAIHCTSKCETFVGRTFSSSSVIKIKECATGSSIMKWSQQTLIEMIEAPPKSGVWYVC